MILNVTLPFSTLDRVQERNGTDAFEDAHEAYGDGIVTCIKCARSFGPEERCICHEQYCPVHGEP